VPERADTAAIVLGRVGADLYPQQINTALEDVRTFERFVGGFAGNVATGLARLEVRVAIVSAVGDDGHGRFVRRFLADEGVDVTWLATHPTLRTALAFCEAWPPDRFPITFYRTPTCPDWQLRPADLPLEAIARSPLFYATGTGLAQEPSRSATLAALDARERRATTIFDLDWREALWEDPAEFPEMAREAAARADVVLGSDTEFTAAGMDPAQVVERGARFAVVKHGPAGATLVEATRSRAVRGLQVAVTNALGAGDAFAAAFGAALLGGSDPITALTRANAAGAIVASRLACSAAMPRPPEIDALLAGGPVAESVMRSATG
jgi:5-dehydro-2-deoxygluconokinase